VRNAPEQGAYLGDYGGIDRIKLSSSRLCIKLNEVGRKALGTSIVKIDYQLDEVSFQNLRDKMKMIFQNADYFTIN